MLSKMLSNRPDYFLIREANRIDIGATDWFGKTLIGIELDLRRPDIVAWYFGDCAGQLIFIPCEPEYDSSGQPIVSEVIGYKEGKEVWLDTQIDKAAIVDCPNCLGSKVEPTELRMDNEAWLIYAEANPCNTCEGTGKVKGGEVWLNTNS